MILQQDNGVKLFDEKLDVLQSNYKNINDKIAQDSNKRKMLAKDITGIPL